MPFIFDCVWVKLKALGLICGNNVGGIFNEVLMGSLLEDALLAGLFEIKKVLLIIVGLNINQ